MGQNVSPTIQARHDQRTRPLRWPSLHAVTMLGMVSLLLLMPVNYRAGAQAAHPHAFFQGMIDLITGEPHEHADDGAPLRAIQAAPTPSATSTAISPFTAADIPLAAARQVVVADSPGETPPVLPATTASKTHVSPDTPQLTNLQPALEQGAAIASIVVMLTMLLAAAAGRLLWFPQPRLTEWSSSCEPPPPRFGVMQVGHVCKLVCVSSVHRNMALRAIGRP